jgi:hypothetical protein
MSKRIREVVAGVRAGSTLKSGRGWAREKRLLAQLQGRDRRRSGGRIQAFVPGAHAKAGPLEMTLVWAVILMLCVATWLAAADLVGVIFLALQGAAS